jgi:hypothetical protein
MSRAQPTDQSELSSLGPLGLCPDPLFFLGNKNYHSQRWDGVGGVDIDLTLFHVVYINYIPFELFSILEPSLSLAPTKIAPMFGVPNRDLRTCGHGGGCV